jgi:tetratricopeptide (TPR) repeat protein
LDAPLTLTGLIEELNTLLEGDDYEGGEELLAQAFGQLPAKHEAFLHFQFGKVYVRWNKLSSALEHFGKAAELSKISGDEMLMIQAVEELRQAKKLQAEQAP